MIVRAAAEADLDAIEKLWLASFEEQRRMDPRFEISPMASIVHRHWVAGQMENDRSRVLVAEAGGPAGSPNDGRGVIGYLLAAILENLPVIPQTQFGMVLELAVDAACRRKGAGRRLVEEAHAWFASRGIEYVEAHVSMYNPAARSFWRAMGYGEFLERLRRPIP